jgi:2,4-dienoyl-CoA reductase-like NADH-dependent reductase (Old Yellow Enzyme family)
MDGIEIHGAHGYLFTQFLSTTENHRTDQWGGSYENRARLLRRTMQAVRARVPKDFIVGVRISPEDGGNARGIDLDESLQLAKWLADDGIDFLHMSLWDAFKPSIKRPTEHPLDIFKRVIPADLPIFAAGHIWDRNDAQKVLDLGADVIALGRSAILNPNWPKDIVDPAWQPKRLPTTPEHLSSVGLQPVFINRLRVRPGFFR